MSSLGSCSGVLQAALEDFYERKYGKTIEKQLNALVVKK